MNIFVNMIQNTIFRYKLYNRNLIALFCLPKQLHLFSTVLKLNLSISLTKSIAHIFLYLTGHDYGWDGHNCNIS